MVIIMFDKFLHRMFLLLFIASRVSAVDYETQSLPKLPFLQSYPSCFIENITWSVEDEAIDIITQIESVQSCQDRCHESPNCRHFTWYDRESTSALNCFLFGDTTTEYPCTNCFSGPKSCPTTTTSTSTSTTSIATTITSSTTTIRTSTSTTTTTITTITTPTTTRPTTTSTTTTPLPTCDVPDPQNHGYWFCPPSSVNPSTCHLECDPGYVSDNATVITCNNGEWSLSPTCVEAVALIAGNYGNSPGNKVEIYGDGLHKELPDLPEDNNCFTLDVVNSLVLLCGGQRDIRSCFVLTSSQQWIPHSKTIDFRMCHTSVSMLGKLHLLSGKESKNTTEVLMPPSDQWNRSWNLIEDNYDSCSVKIGPEMLVMTGGHNNKTVITVIMYNVTNGEATRLQNLKTGRFYHGCIYVKNPNTGFRGVLVAGGQNGNYGERSSEMYDITGGEWTITGQLTKDRIGRGNWMVILGETILAMGGARDNTVEKFNLTSGQWAVGENMLGPRLLHAVTGVPPIAVGINEI